MTPSQSKQTFSHYPALPLPFPLPLVETGDQVCPYLPDRMETTRGVYVTGNVSDGAFQHLMDTGFRRSGRVFYQPICRGCRQCIPIRLRIGGFVRSKSQRRIWNKNRDLRVMQRKPELSEEKYALYRKYITQWHGRSADDSSRQAFAEWLYESPVQTVEFEYRNEDNVLLAVGICDIAANSLSSVYFYFDPDASQRSLGTYSALWEIDFARGLDRAYYYLGYYVSQCPAMSYKSRFQPAELLDTDGRWRPMDRL